MTTLERMLQDERTNLRAELEGIRESIATSEQRLAVIIERLRHVDGLLGEVALDTNPAASGSAKMETDPVRFDGDSITDLAEKVLLQQPGETMYYKDLTKEVQRLGGQINGADPAATLVARLVNDERFVRPRAKGFYGLRADFPTARNVGARAVRRRTRSN